MQPEEQDDSELEEEPEPRDPELDDDDDLEEEPRSSMPDLPPLYAHGDPDPRPLKSWLIKHLMPAAGTGCSRASGAPAKRLWCSIWRPR